MVYWGIYEQDGSTMKHVFILNPMAGDGKHLAELHKKLKSLDGAELYETTAPADATRYVRKRCESDSQPIRFYACGGDGTIKEVAEGIVGHPHASMSVYPIGSGNDFVKYFGGADGFFDLDAITGAEAVDTDIIHIRDDAGVDAYSLNVCNFGFEAYVAKVMNKVRRKVLIGGKNAYTTGIIAGIFCAMRNRGRVFADGEELAPKGVFLLGTAANGGYVGGGYHCAPRASVTDGMLEICLVKPISIFTLLKLIGVYKAGKHLEDPRFQKYLVYRRAKQLEISSDKPFAICLDGEIIETTRFTATAKSGQIRFAAPAEKEPATV